MKPTTTAIPFLASLLLTTASPTPSPSTIYTLKIKSTVPAIRNTTLVLKDDVGTPSTPTPLGSFSTGEPRYPYTFTLSPISVRENLYELRSTAAQTHLILNGDARAPQLFDGVVGQDPAPGTGLTRSRWLLVDQGERMEIVSAEDVAGSNSFRGAGTWRACNQGTVDWSMFWFDGLSNLTAIIPGYGCESVGVYLEEVQGSSATTARITKATAFITGVGAPTTTSKAWITGVGAPKGNTTKTGVLPVFTGAATQLGMTDVLVGLAAGAAAALL